MKTKSHPEIYGAYAKYLKLKRDGGISEVNRSVPQHLLPPHLRSRGKVPDAINQGAKSANRS